MRRIPRQIRLDPTFDRRVREYIAGTGGEMTVTDVLHKSLADFFRVLDGGPTLERVAGDVHALGYKIEQGENTVAAAINEMRKGVEKIGTDQIRAQTNAQREVVDLRNQVATLAGQIEQLVGELQAMRSERKRGIFG